MIKKPHKKLPEKLLFSDKSIVFQNRSKLQAAVLVKPFTRN